MAWDLSRTPRTGLRVQCCGDAHLSNFGVFAAPDRRLVFDLNDFDETLPAPFEWDLKRLVASIVVAARGNGHRPKEQRAAARATVAAYRTTMAAGAAMRFLDVWYTRVDVDELFASLTANADAATIKLAKKSLSKARSRTSLGSLSKFATKVDGGHRIKQQPPIIVRPPEDQRDDAEQLVRQGLIDYENTLTPDRRVVLDHYHYEDFARNGVGVGSVGTEAFMLLLMGDLDDDPLFLQIKEATTSVLAPYAGASEYDHQGERIVQGQRLVQAASDAFLGWVTGTGEQHREFYVRQLRDMKGQRNVRRRDGETLELVEDVVDGVMRDVGAHDRASRPRAIDDARPCGARHGVQPSGDARHDAGLSEHLEVEHAAETGQLRLTAVGSAATAASTGSPYGPSSSSLSPSGAAISTVALPVVSRMTVGARRAA